MRRERPLTASLSDLTFQDLLGVFKRQKWWVVGMFLLGLLAAGLYTMSQRPGYLSFAQMRLEGTTQATRGVNPNSAVNQITDPVVDLDVLTQMQLLQGAKIFYRALDQAGLPAPQTAADLDKLPEVRVNQVGTTQIVQLSVVAEREDKAVQLTNAFLEQYRLYRETEQRDRISRSLQFVNARLADEARLVAKLETDLSTARSQSGVVDLSTEAGVRSQTKATAENRLNDLIGALNGARNRLSALQQAASAEGNGNRVTTTTTTNIEQRLAEEKELDTLKAQRDALLVTFFEDAPQVRAIDERIREQEERVNALKSEFVRREDTRNPNVDYWKQQVALAQGEVRSLEAQVSQAQSAVSQRSSSLDQLTPLVAKISELGRQLSERQESLRRLTATRDELQLRNNELSTPVEVITSAQPARKIRPNIPVNLLLGAVLGLVLGALIGISIDIAQDKVNTADNATYVTEKDVLARIPIRARSASPVISDPARARAFENYRLLRSSVLLATAEENVGAFVVASARPKEGKSVIASNFAVALALEGKRVILVDANLRAPALHKMFNLKDEKGLSEAALNPTILDEVLQETATPGLQVLTAGERVTNPTELLGSANMGKLIEVLKSKADFLVFDTAPGFVYADAQSLVTHVPTVLFVTDLVSPSKSDLRESVAMLDYAHANVLGLVINKDRGAGARLAKG